MKRQFCNTFISITKELKKEKELYKELLHLIEDKCDFSEKERPEICITALKLTFRDNALQSFLQLRECTKLLLERFPLKSEIDDNLICTLPNEVFDSYNNDEELKLKDLKVFYNYTKVDYSYNLLLFSVTQATNSSSDI